MRMKNIIRTVAMGAILAVSGFARAGEVGEPLVLSNDPVTGYEPNFTYMPGGRAARIFKAGSEASVDKVNFHLNRYVNKKEVVDDTIFRRLTLSEKRATVDKTEKVLEEELKELVKKVAKISTTTKITEAMVVEKIPFWCQDGYGQGNESKSSDEGKEYYYRYFEFVKFKFQLEGESAPRFYHGLTIYSRDKEAQEKEDARVAKVEEKNRREGTNEPVNKKDEKHIFLKTKNYVLDGLHRKSGNGNEGTWFDEEGGYFELEGR